MIEPADWSPNEVDALLEDHEDDGQPIESVDTDEVRALLHELTDMWRSDGYRGSEVDTRRGIWSCY